MPISSLEIVSVEFLSDHNMLKDYNADFLDGGARFPKPEWTPGKQVPVSHNMDKQVQIKVTIQVGPTFPNSPADACDETGTLTGKGPGGMVFEQANFVFKPGTNILTLTSDKNVQHKVQALDFKISWTVTGTSVGISPSDTANKMYVTYADPFKSSPSQDNAVTERRLSFLCASKCNGDTNGHDSVKKVHDISSAYDPSAAQPSPHWLLADGKIVAQCVDSAIFYMLASEMLGLKTGKVVLIYPKLGKGSKEAGFGDDPENRVVKSSKPPHPAKTTHGALDPTENLCFYDKPGLRNNFEACFKFTHPDASGATVTKYYGGGAGIYDTPDAVMKAVCHHTVWIFEAAILPDEKWLDCTTPGPSPAETW